MAGHTFRKNSLQRFCGKLETKFNDVTVPNVMASNRVILESFYTRQSRLVNADEESSDVINTHLNTAVPRGDVNDRDRMDARQTNVENSSQETVAPCDEFCARSSVEQNFLGRPNGFLTRDRECGSRLGFLFSWGIFALLVLGSRFVQGQPEFVDGGYEGLVVEIDRSVPEHRCTAVFQGLENLCLHAGRHGHMPLLEDFRLLVLPKSFIETSGAAFDIVGFADAAFDIVGFDGVAFDLVGFAGSDSTSSDLQALLSTSSDLQALLSTSSDLQALLLTSSDLHALLSTSSDLHALLSTSSDLQVRLVTSSDLQALVSTSAQWLDLDTSLVLGVAAETIATLKQLQSDYPRKVLK
ncbi:uncharacterized protein LOC125179498 [Hyalella azteca]|uniref:Uncharacterized protein LOC125179498 n=1 Tax=Hyalella azteca TaxID=294128 RepID=A0A979FW41_HYAAZ|nr:uncharacterized protein LOC125179498 [Hyalella azteca]